MKKITMAALFILFLSFGLFCQETKYTQMDLDQYMLDMPGSHLPDKGQEIFVRAGFFSVEYSNDDPLGGIDYLVASASPLNGAVGYSKLLFIFSENIQTRKLPPFQSRPAYTTIFQDITIKFTGQFLTAINSRGQEVEVPIFITK